MNSKQRVIHSLWPSTMLHSVIHSKYELIESTSVAFLVEITKSFIVLVNLFGIEI